MTVDAATGLDLEAIEARRRSAGDWHINGQCGYETPCYEDGEHDLYTVDIPALIVEVRRLRAEVERLTEAVIAPSP
jgi:hypothetical protein